jgi:hypothetical protein
MIQNSDAKWTYQRGIYTPSQNVVVAVLGADYPAKKGVDYPEPRIIWP